MIRRYKKGTQIIHSEDGPALEFDDGTKCWYIEGKLHRTDGPAMQFANGNKEYYLYGIKVNCEDNQEFLDKIKFFTDKYSTFGLKFALKELLINEDIKRWTKG